MGKTKNTQQKTLMLEHLKNLLPNDPDAIQLIKRLLQDF
jgi:hypothetical protein